jgi:hypothetical protein
MRALGLMCIHYDQPEPDKRGLERERYRAAKSLLIVGAKLQRIRRRPVCSPIVRRFVMSKISAIAFAGMLSVVPLNFANADQPGPDWMPAETGESQSNAVRLYTGYEA